MVFQSLIHYFLAIIQPPGKPQKLEPVGKLSAARVASFSSSGCINQVLTLGEPTFHFAGTPRVWADHTTWCILYPTSLRHPVAVG
jgi:hypothetical protein